ncbi:tetratricopeptide repeat protein [Mycoplasma amphoriforme]
MKKYTKACGLYYLLFLTFSN